MNSKKKTNNCKETKYLQCQNRHVKILSDTPKVENKCGAKNFWCGAKNFSYGTKKKLAQHLFGNSLHDPYCSRNMT